MLPFLVSGLQALGAKVGLYIHEHMLSHILSPSITFFSLLLTSKSHRKPLCKQIPIPGPLAV